MICRVADLRFRNSQVEAEELVSKLEYVLDDLLAIIDEETVVPEVDLSKMSASDDDY